MCGKAYIVCLRCMRIPTKSVIAVRFEAYTRIRTYLAINCGRRNSQTNAHIQSACVYSWVILENLRALTFVCVVCIKHTRMPSKHITYTGCLTKLWKRLVQSIRLKVVRLIVGHSVHVMRNTFIANIRGILCTRGGGDECKYALMFLYYIFTKRT
jgi:hypothetical protein